MIADGWKARAACAGLDVELFFPPSANGRGAGRDAKAICKACPVRAECLAYALARPEQHGVWGGISENERALMRWRTQRRESARIRRATTTSNKEKTA